MNKAHKMMKEKSLIKEKKPSSWKIFNEWCRRRSNKQKTIICLLALLFVVAFPYNIFCLRTYVASWDLYWNSNLPYRIGEKISKKELEECFVQTNTKHYPFPEYGYQGESDVISALKTSRYPISFLPLPQKVTRIHIQNDRYQIYGIFSGMDIGEANEIMIGQGFRKIRDDTGMSKGRGMKIYRKGGIFIRFGEIEGKTTAVLIDMMHYTDYLESILTAEN